MEVTNGTRYILTGFCSFADPINNSYKIFSPELYSAVNDGFAFRDGFRTNDIIIGIQHCRIMNHESENVVTIDGSSSKSQVMIRNIELVNRSNFTFSDWVQVAQSCEKLSPNDKTVLIIERSIN